MSDGQLYMHYVSTIEEARELINRHDKFWVSNCGCREGKGICRQSRMDVCLMFSMETGASGTGLREIGNDEVKELLREAMDKKLVARPFRNNDFTDTDGICFCCQDCCGYFTENDEHCNKGKFIESTTMDNCTQCGLCVSVCYFGARKMSDGTLSIDSENCYGCGLCVVECPMQCISMTEKP